MYIAEAHFVERDSNSNLIDGWPIGYDSFEFPQPKDIESRLKMITTAINYNGGLSFLKAVDSILCDDMSNTFLNFFGAWPDSAFIFRNNSLVFKAKVDVDGYMSSEFATQMDNFIGNDK